MVAAKPLIYLIDDDDPVRDSLSAFLSMSGFRVEAFDSAEPLVVDPLPRPDGLILDLHLPGLSGLDAWRLLRERYGGAAGAPPVVIITGRGQRSTERAAIAAGANGYLEKPFSGPELLAILDRLVPRGTGSSSDQFGSGDSRGGNGTT